MRLLFFFGLLFSSSAALAESNRVMIAACHPGLFREMKIVIYEVNTAYFDERLQTTVYQKNYEIVNTFRWRETASFQGAGTLNESARAISAHIVNDNSYAHFFINKETGQAQIEVEAQFFERKLGSYECIFQPN